MTELAEQEERVGLLVPPSYAPVEAIPRKPTLREIMVEWVDAVAFWRDGTRLLPAFYAAYHLATFGIFVFFFITRPSISGVLAIMAISSGIATLYNTVWYHRYCSHRAFKFRSLRWTRLFLWTNPVCFREECYVIPHRVHHWSSDEPGDPYGPHLGWLGSYLATESQQKFNRNISRAEYDRFAKSLEHIGFPRNSYEQFQRTGSVENLWHYAARTVFVNLLWPAAAFAVAGWTGALAWFSGVFLYTFLVRDFNYRGHGGLLGTQPKGIPLNQVFYGLVAGEWHENHHNHPRLARSGLAWWQMDIPYCIIKAMSLCRIVTHYNSSPGRSAEAGPAAQNPAAQVLQGPLRLWRTCPLPVSPDSRKVLSSEDLSRQ
jgi:fatty-acid desaturase